MLKNSTIGKILPIRTSRLGKQRKQHEFGNFEYQEPYSLHVVLFEDSEVNFKEIKRNGVN
jgi:hypothetical protein